MASGFLGIALGVAGAAAFIASGFVTGGASWALLGAAVVAMGAGAAISATAAQPEPISQVHRQVSSTSDPEAPWEWVYGSVVKGAHVPWSGVGGDEDHWSGADYVIACHPCEELLAVQIGEWYLPIVTTIDGDTNANGLGLMLNTGQALTTKYPATWYIPVHGGANGNSPWWRNDQGDENTPDEAHVAIRFVPGTQTVTDPTMAHADFFGTKYSGVARKFIGHTVAHVIILANTELGTVGQLPTILWHVRGKNDIQNHAGTSAQYRNNCAHVFADYCREQLGIPVTDIVNLQDAATECDDTTWDPLGTAGRYTFDGVIRDDMEPVEALKLIASHMAGGWSERGDKIYLWTGTVKTAWADGPLTPDDVAGPITITPPDEDGWANSLWPHFIVQRPLGEDGKRILHGRMEPAKRHVTSATYVTEDGGETLRQDIKFQACIIGRRAKFMAWIALKQMRLGASLQGRFKKRAVVLEVGDVVALSLPEFFPNGTKFQVVSKAIGLGAETFSVDLGLVRYEDEIYEPDTEPTEDEIGVVPKNRSTIMPAITGLAAAVLEDSAQVQANGIITVDVVVSWDLVPNRLVRTSGDVRIAWKKQSVSWPRNATTVPGDQIQAVIPGMRQGVAYHVRARAEGSPSAGRGDKPVGRWTSNLGFTPESGYLDLDGPPSPAGQGPNRVTDPNLERGPNSQIWDLDDGAATATGTATIQTTGGKVGPHRLLINITAASVGHVYRVENTLYIPCAPGDWFICRTFVAKTSGRPDFEARVNVNYFDRDKAFVLGHAIFEHTISDTPWPERREIGRFQVPPAGDDITFLRLLWQHVALSAGAQQSVWDGLILRDLDIMRSATTTTQLDTSDTTNWSNLASLVDFQGGDEDDIFFDGDTEVAVSGVVYAQVQRGTTNITSRTRAVARLRLEEVGVGTTSIVTQVRVAYMAVADGLELGSNGVTDEQVRVLEATITPGAGHYKLHLEGRMLGDATNGEAQFLTRWIRVVKN